MSDSWRMFVALPLSGPVREGLVAYQRTLAAAGVRARWVKESQFHITLKFLGDVPAAAADSLVQALCDAVLDFPGFEVAFRGVSAFPDRRRPRVLWAAPEGAPEALLRLAERVEAACARLGIARSDRPFHPHVTLGRLRPEEISVGWERAAVELEGRLLGPERVRRVVLFRSRLAPSGPAYTELGSAILGNE